VILVLVVAYQNAYYNFPGRSLFAAVFLGVITLTALLGSIQVWRAMPVGRALLVAPGINLVLVGVPAIFSIGYLLLLAALIMLGAGFIGGRPPLWRTVTFTLAGAITLGGGFYLTR
jgi:hypothetical protein